MNRQEALSYIESGAEATKSNDAINVRRGQAVRLLGYGYKSPTKISPRGYGNKLEDWADLRSDDARGVLVEVIRYHSYEVVQLRQLHAITVEQAKVEYDELMKRYKRDRAEKAAKYERDKADAAMLTEQLGGEINTRIGTTMITLTIDQARALVARLDNVVVGSAS